MRPFTARIAVTAFLCAGGLTGCHGLARHPSYPADPLFVIKKPLEAKAEIAPPALVARAEPEIPQVPATVLAVRRSATERSGPLPSSGEHRVAYPPAPSTAPAPFPTSSNAPASSSDLKPAAP